MRAVCVLNNPLWDKKVNTDLKTNTQSSLKVHDKSEQEKKA